MQLVIVINCSRRPNPAKPDLLHQPSKPTTMDAEPASTQPSGLRPTTTQQHAPTSSTTNGPEPTVLTAELRQLPTPTTHVGAKPPRNETDAIGQHRAKYGPKCPTKLTEQRQKHQSEPEYGTDTNKCTEYDTKPNSSETGP